MTAMEVENNLRKFLNEILQPFQERIQCLNKDVKSVKSSQENAFASISVISKKIENQTKIQKDCDNLSKTIQQLVSVLPLIFSCL